MKTRHLTNSERLLLKSALLLADKYAVDAWEFSEEMGKYGDWHVYRKHINALLVLVASPCDIDIHLYEGNKQ